MNDLLVYLTYIFKGDARKVAWALKEPKEINTQNIQNVINELKAKNISYITIFDSEFPEQLKDLENAPLVLFYRGDLSLLANNKYIATGDNNTPLALEQIEASSAILMKDYTYLTNDFNNLEKDVKNYAIKKSKPIIHLLACGHDNFKIEEYNENNLYISQYPPQTNYKSIRFKERASLTAVLCDFLIIYNSNEKSGAVNLAYTFAHYNKEVYCYPGLSVEDGNNTLIKQGANLITTIADIGYY